ncbi:MAG: polysaccharide deacetylase [bacterium]|nr:polysaccharide deacetylase [bacterium]
MVKKKNLILFKIIISFLAFSHLSCDQDKNKNNRSEPAVKNIPNESGKLAGYEKYFAECNLKGDKQTLISLRKYSLEGKDYFLLVDPQTLETSTRRIDELDIIQDTANVIEEKYANTVYFKAIKYSKLNSQKTQDAGITQLLPSKHGIDLTIDLCPSKLPLDTTLFNELIKELGKIEKPVPVAIAITGKWLEKHEKDLKWLMRLQKNNDLSITWINHSYNHKYNKELPLNENFLLETGTDINYEVLQIEVKMLESGIIPSVFFRFPGLVSNDKIFKNITDFGLIPIGSDAWLSKNQIVKDGSIVLVHANGNDPIGVSKFLQLLTKEKGNILNKQWFLYDLRESVVKLGEENF